LIPRAGGHAKPPAGIEIVTASTLKEAIGLGLVKGRPKPAEKE
jgi:hypothetical protein